MCASHVKTGNRHDHPARRSTTRRPHPRWLAFRLVTSVHRACWKPTSLRRHAAPRDGHELGRDGPKLMAPSHNEERLGDATSELAMSHEAADSSGNEYGVLRSTQREERALPGSLHLGSGAPRARGLGLNTRPRNQGLVIPSAALVGIVFRNCALAGGQTALAFLVYTGTPELTTFVNRSMATGRKTTLLAFASIPAAPPHPDPHPRQESVLARPTRAHLHPCPVHRCRCRAA